MPTPLIPHRDRYAHRVDTLKRVSIGASATVGGLLVQREAENAFRVEYAGEAIIGSADSVVDWMEQLKNASWS